MFCLLQVRMNSCKIFSFEGSSTLLYLLFFIYYIFLICLSRVFFVVTHLSDCTRQWIQHLKLAVSVFQQFSRILPQYLGVASDSTAVVSTWMCTLVCVSADRWAKGSFSNSFLPLSLPWSPWQPPTASCQTVNTWGGWSVLRGTSSCCSFFGNQLLTETGNYYRDIPCEHYIIKWI